MPSSAGALVRVLVHGDSRADAAWLEDLRQGLPDAATLVLCGAQAESGRARRCAVRTSLLPTVRPRCWRRPRGVPGDHLALVRSGTALPPHWLRACAALALDDALVASPLDNTAPGASPLPTGAHSTLAAGPSTASSAPTARAACGFRRDLAAAVAVARRAWHRWTSPNCRAPRVPARWAVARAAARPSVWPIRLARTARSGGARSGQRRAATVAAGHRAPPSVTRCTLPAERTPVTVWTAARSCCMYCTAGGAGPNASCATWPRPTAPTATSCCWRAVHFPAPLWRSAGTARWQPHRARPALAAVARHRRPIPRRCRLRRGAGPVRADFAPAAVLVSSSSATAWTCCAPVCRRSWWPTTATPVATAAPRLRRSRPGLRRRATRRRPARRRRRLRVRRTRPAPLADPARRPWRRCARHRRIWWLQPQRPGQCAAPGPGMARCRNG